MIKQDLKEIKDDLKAVRADATEIRVHVAAIKVDVAHHVKRSDAADGRIQKLEYTLVGLLGTVVAAALIKWLIS